MYLYNFYISRTVSSLENSRVQKAPGPQASALVQTCDNLGSESISKR